MTAKRARRFGKVRAWVGAMAVLLSAVAAPLTLAADTQRDVCAMLCCIEDGFCCCKPAKSSVKGLPRNSHTSFTQSNLVKSCPQGCAPAATSSPQTTRLAAPPSTQALRRLAPVVTAAAPPPAKQRHLARALSAPRAPPFVLTTSA